MATERVNLLRRLATITKKETVPRIEDIRWQHLVELIRSHATVSDILATWPPALEGICDICNVDITSQSSHRVSAEMFKRIVTQGYNPIERERVDTRSFDEIGQSAAHYYEQWKFMVAKNTGDWGLCLGCADDIARFLLGMKSLGR